MDDQATFEFDYIQQAWVLKAMNLHTGQDAAHVIPGMVHSWTWQLRENWSVLEDTNFALRSWGWQELAPEEWHGLFMSSLAAQLTPAR